MILMEASQWFVVSRAPRARRCLRRRERLKDWVHTRPLPLGFRHVRALVPSRHAILHFLSAIGFGIRRGLTVRE